MCDDWMVCATKEVLGHVKNRKYATYLVDTKGFLSQATYISAASTVLLYLGVMERSFLDMMRDIHPLIISDGTM